MGCGGECGKGAVLDGFRGGEGEGGVGGKGPGVRSLLAGDGGEIVLTGNLVLNKAAKVQAFKVQDKLFESGNQKKWNLEYVGSQTKGIIKKNE